MKKMMMIMVGRLVLCLVIVVVEEGIGETTVVVGVVVTRNTNNCSVVAKTIQPLGVVHVGVVADDNGSSTKDDILGTMLLSPSAWCFADWTMTNDSVGHEDDESVIVTTRRRNPSLVPFSCIQTRKDDHSTCRRRLSPAGRSRLALRLLLLV